MVSERRDWGQGAAEPPLEPNLPICDSHHHLWDRPGDSYLADEFLTDMATGHNIVSTVAVECHARYRATGPEEMRPTGETEFLDALARGTDGHRGPTVVAAGIIGHVNLTLGPAAVTMALEGHLTASPGRFRGIRHICTWDASPAIPSAAPVRRAGLMLDRVFRESFAVLQTYKLSFDACLFHPQLLELASLAHAFPDVTIVVNHTGACWHRSPSKCTGQGVPDLEAGYHRHSLLSKRGDEARRSWIATLRVRLGHPGRSSRLRRTGRGDGPVLPHLH